MRKGIWKQLKRRVESTVAHIAGGRFGSSDKKFSPGMLLFEATAGRHHKFFLSFDPSTRFDAFFVEFAWCDDGIWPAFPTFLENPARLPLLPSGRIRIEELWLSPPYNMYAWCVHAPVGLRQLSPYSDADTGVEIPEGALDKVVAEVADAIVEYVVPVMDRFESMNRKER